jgi:two-component sensor histidine kinase
MQNAGSRILYIDDEIGLCRLAQRQLERLGFIVTLAHSGPDGLALAREQAFDLVALDHYMPGQDGIETLGELMQLPHVPAVVYVTGSDETHIAVSALKAGAADYVVKSANDDFFDLLGRTINQALDARRILAEKERAEQRLRESNAQLQTMLREMNHRVANSLQMVSSLVKLQARRATTAESQAIMRDIRHRIDAVYRVHRQLYVSGDGTTVGMVDYITGLVEDMTLTFSNITAARPIRVMAGAVDLPASDAISLGICISELVSNACKYAYAEDQNGEVRVIFTPLGGNGFRLVVEDDGRGLAKNSAPTGTGLGTQIIHAMTHSLGATLNQTNTGNGFRITLERPPT